MTTRHGSVSARVLDWLRRVKHRLFVLRKHAGWKWHMVWVTAADPPWRLWQTLRPYSWDRRRHDQTFLGRDSHVEPLMDRPVPRRIFVVWTGDNELSVNRRRGLQSIIDQNRDLEVILVDQDNLPTWILPEFPLHPAYDHLSFIHRSDYLRGYLLHHHGGGYCDLKRIRGSWAPAFERLDKSDAWIVGYTEVRFDMVARIPGALGRDLVRASSQVLGNGSFIARPNTPFTDELVSEQERRLDVWAEELRRSPGGVRGEGPNYPVPWVGLMGEITGPLCLKYQSRILHDRSIMVEFKDYQ